MSEIPDLEARIEALLRDNAADPAVLALLQELYDRYRTQERLLDRLTHISDRFQRAERDRGQSYAENYQRKVRQIEKIVRISDQYQSMLRDLNDRLHTISTQDELTGLPNRRFMQARLTQEIAQAERNGSDFCIALADIDRFKAINDRFGHPFGDHVITRFGAILEAQAGPKGCVVRLGGEEFAVLLPGSSLDNAVATASRMQRAFALERWLHIETDDQFTASFGLALVKDQESIADAIGRADRLLYAAKRAGRDCIVVDHCLSTDCKDCRREVNGYPACPDAPSIASTPTVLARSPRNI